MASMADLIQQGATNLWVFVPTAIGLGFLHGLEPGHSKTMMASFIVAIRGTVAQAVLLGLCAALSHSLIVWALAAAALHFGNALIAEQAEPYLMLVSAAVVLAMAVWMAWRTRQDIHAAHHHHHHHGHDHDHHHHHHDAQDSDYEDAHARAHAEDIAKRFAGRHVTTPQIALFGLSGGLVPCPASVTVLMVCLHVKEFTLGAAMVASFSLGLAIALVGVGVIAAWGVRHLEQRQGKSRWLAWARRAPYVSSALMALVGVLMTAHAVSLLAA